MPFDRRHFLSLSSAVLPMLPLAPLATPNPAVAAPARQVAARIKLKDQTELFVRDWGEGRPVILTHAWPLSSDCWEQQALALVAAGFRVIFYDRRGFGRSSQPPGGYDYDTFADDLKQVIAATAAKDATLVGFSMGGGEIVRYFSRHGARGIVKAGLVASVVPGLAKGPHNPGGVDPAFFDGLKASLQGDRASFLSTLLKDVFYDVKASEKSSTPISQAVLDWSFQMAMQAGVKPLVDCVDAFGKEDFTPDLAAVTVPTLVLHGDADKPVPLALTGQRAAAGIKQSRLVTYAGTTHGLLVSERERVSRDLIAFVRG